MKLNVDEFYLVYQPHEAAEEEDLLEKTPMSMNRLAKFFKDGFKPSDIYGLYNTKREAKAAVKGIMASYFLPEKNVSKNAKERFRGFIKGLEKLSSGYGIAIHTLGGVYVFEEPTAITYEENLSSGNLVPSWNGK